MWDFLKRRAKSPNGADPDPTARLLAYIDRLVEAEASKMMISSGRTLPPAIARLASQLHTLEICHCDIADVTQIAHLTGLRRLKLLNVPVADLSPLASLTNLRELSIARLPDGALDTLPDIPTLTTFKTSARIDHTGGPGGMAALEDLSLTLGSIGDAAVLNGKPRLRRLRTGTYRPADLSGLATLTQLESLSVTSESARSLDPLSRLTALSDLELRAPMARDVSPLAGLTGLTKLSCNTDVETVGHAALHTLTQLTTMTIGPVPADPDFGWIADLHHLTFLSLWIDGESDLRALSHLPRLEKLVLHVRGHVDLSVIGTLSSVTSLVIDAQPDTQTRIVGWPMMPRVAKVALQNRVAADLSGLAAFETLFEFNLSNTLISDLSPLAGMPNLAVLSLSRSPVEDLSVLATLPTFTRGGGELALNDIPFLTLHPSLRGAAGMARGRDGPSYRGALAQEVMTLLARKTRH